MALIADGRYEQVGTFNGNPLGDGGGPGDAHRGAHPGGVRSTSSGCASRMDAAACRT